MLACDDVKLVSQIRMIACWYDCLLECQVLQPQDNDTAKSRYIII